MAFYKTCERCGATLDPDEKCDCIKKESDRKTSDTLTTHIYFNTQQLKNQAAKA